MATYEPIATTTLSSATASIVFSSIPATYTDLRIVLNYTGTNVTSSVTPILRFNSDGGANYHDMTLTQTNTSLNGGQGISRDSIRLAGGLYQSATIPSLMICDIFSYRVGVNKTVISVSSSDIGGAGSQTVCSGIWRNNAVISTINIDRDGTGSYDVGTIATLYGILAA